MKRKLLLASIAALLCSLQVPSVCAQHTQWTGDELTEVSKKSTTLAYTKSLEPIHLSALEKKVEGKTVVVLGEFTHGAGEIFDVQNSIVKHLQQTAGFDVVLFESGIGELHFVNSGMDELTPEELTAGFFGGWRNSSRRDLMEYIQGVGIDVAGFDVQRFGNYFSKSIEGASWFNPVDDSLITTIESRFTEVSAALRSLASDSVLEETTALINDYMRVEELLQRVDAQSIFAKTIGNRIAYLKYYLDFMQTNDWQKRFDSRDSLMADNILWLRSNLFPNRKIIVITHNYHAARTNTKGRTMGVILAEELKSEYFAVGMFAGSGSYHDNSGREKTMSDPDSTRADIVHLARALPGYASFICLGDKATPLNREVVSNDTFLDLYGSNTMNPAKMYDALIILDSVSPPR